jgi:transposase
MQPGASIASVAMANGINANLARRWVLEVERGTGETAIRSAGQVFVPLQLPAPVEPVAAEIRIEVRRGPTLVSVSWPGAAAAECAIWMREFLR